MTPDFARVWPRSICATRDVGVTADGVGSWTSAGVGWFTETGGTAFRGSAYLTIAPPKLAHLTRAAILYEFDIAADAFRRRTVLGVDIARATNHSRTTLSAAKRSDPWYDPW